MTLLLLGMHMTGGETTRIGNNGKKNTGVAQRT